MSLIEVIEMQAFTDFADKALSTDELQNVINTLAANPDYGYVMHGTGGLRKARFGRGTKGKAHGIRVVYYYHSTAVPLFLIAGYTKKEADNLTKSEKNEIRKMIEEINQIYSKQQVKGQRHENHQRTHK